jgi:polar amino acid transport system substrate-binding protein
MRGHATRRWAGTGLAAALLGSPLLLGTPGTVSAQAVDLAPTGALRVAAHPANAALAARDPATGEWRGPWIDLAGALARRLGVPVAFVEYANEAAVVAAAAAGAWDVTSASVTPERAALGLMFAAPYLEVDNSLLVGPGAAIRSTADADRPGVRIAAVGGTAPELSLTARLRQAQVVRVAPSPDINRELAALLTAGQVDAVANNRANVLGLAALVPGSRVLADRYAVQEQRIALPPGRSAASLSLASDVTRQALASGLIRTSIARAGTVGVQPAAAGAPGGLPRTGGAPSQPAWTAVAGLAAAAGLLVATRRRRPRR